MSKLKLLTGADHEIVMEREFDAPRRLVVRAMTEPALIKRWLGNDRAAIVAVEADHRVGGAYRYGFRRPDGFEFSFSGEYRELGEARVVQTQRMDGSPGEAVVTTTWTEHGGKTTMRVVMAFDSQMVRDIVFGTGMADGAGESYDQLEQLVANL